MTTRIWNWIKSRWHKLMKTTRMEPFAAKAPEADPDYKFIYLNRKQRRQYGTSSRWARAPK